VSDDLCMTTLARVGARTQLLAVSQSVVHPPNTLPVSSRLSRRVKNWFSICTFPGINPGLDVSLIDPSPSVVNRGVRILECVARDSLLL
jgi:hypothetical protein